VHDDPRTTLSRNARTGAASDRRPPACDRADREAVALAPNDADAWYNLVVALQEGGGDVNAREAAFALDEATKRDPGRPELHNIRRDRPCRAGRLLAAEKEFRATIAADPRNARAYNNLGNVLRAMNRLAEAAEAYRKAIELARVTPTLNGLVRSSSQAARRARPSPALTPR